MRYARSQLTLLSLILSPRDLARSRETISYRIIVKAHSGDTPEVANYILVRCSLVTLHKLPCKQCSDSCRSFSEVLSWTADTFRCRTWWSDCHNRRSWTTSSQCYCRRSCTVLCWRNCMTRPAHRQCTMPRCRDKRNLKRWDQCV